jgi:hypothetical protein
MFSLTWASALLLAGSAITAIHAIDPISAVGSKFFYSNGTQYFIKGTPAPVSTRRNALRRYLD